MDTKKVEKVDKIAVEKKAEEKEINDLISLLRNSPVKTYHGDYSIDTSETKPRGERNQVPISVQAAIPNNYIPSNIQSTQNLQNIQSLPSMPGMTGVPQTSAQFIPQQQYQAATAFYGSPLPNQSTQIPLPSQILDPRVYQPSPTIYPTQYESMTVPPFMGRNINIGDPQFIDSSDVSSMNEPLQRLNKIRQGINSLRSQVFGNS
jgi:hypothetical protein